MSEVIKYGRRWFHFIVTLSYQIDLDVEALRECNIHHSAENSKIEVRNSQAVLNKITAKVYAALYCRSPAT